VRFLTRLWPRRSEQPGLTMAVQLVTLQQPIPLAERQPGPDDMDAIDYDCCYWGDWQEDHWIWKWGSGPWRDETHWLPASVQVLPARCCPPEVQP
jgi:hypothetical protein